MSYIYPKAGASLGPDGTCTFTVWAPEKKEVSLILEDYAPNTVCPMTVDERGYWTVSTESVGEGTRYRFQIDGSNPLPDPASRYQPEGVHGPSAVVDTRFNWTDHAWKGISLKDMVIYELHTGTFTHEGTFDAIVSRLPYLRNLGINAIELMPVAQFPGNRNWGYDGVFPFAVQDSYGGPTALKRLINEAHQHEIAVILDVVYNHQGPEGNYLGEFGPYFTEKYRTWWGKAINFDDAYCDGVRNFYLQNALMWLEEFHVDGLRIDAAHAIWDNSAVHFLELLSEKAKALEDETGMEKVLIAEFDLNNPRYIKPRDEGGLGLDGQWIDEFHHALHSLVTGERSGYYEDFGDAAHLAKAYQHSYVYTGEYSPHRKKHFGVSPKGCESGQFVVFSQNHDQIGNRLMGDRLTTQLSYEGLKLVAAAVLLAPQVPMIFMGEEYGEKHPFQYFISHTDPDLVQMVRDGRKKEFSYFNWEGPIPDPQSEETFRQCILSLDEQKDKFSERLFGFYKHLIGFRKRRIAYRGQHQDSVRVHEPGISSVIAFERMFGTDRILVVLNFDKSPAPFRLASPAVFPARKILDSSSVEWLGPGEITFSTFNNNHEILLHGESVVIFEY